MIKHVQELLNQTIVGQKALPKSFTPEALIKEMSRATERTPNGLETHCYWIKDEIAGFFKQLKRKESYMTEADDILSSVYDGTTTSRGTITRGMEIVKNPYLTCLLASTDYLPALFDELQLRLGFLNRFIFVIGKRKQRKEIRTEDLSIEEESRNEEIKKFLQAIANKTTVTTLEMSDEAKQIYNNFEKQIDDKIDQEDLGVKEGYYGQLPNLVIRLSCLYRMSQLSAQEVGNPNLATLIVEKQDVERAITYVGKVWEWFKAVIGIMNLVETKKLPKVEQAKPAILELLDDGKEHHWRSIVKFVDELVEVKQANVYVALGRLEQEGKIEKTRPGHYKIKAPAANTQDK